MNSLPISSRRRRRGVAEILRRARAASFIYTAYFRLSTQRRLVCRRRRGNLRWEPRIRCDSSAAAQSAPNPLCSYEARASGRSQGEGRRELANKDSSNPPLCHRAKIAAVQLRCLLHWQRKSLVSSRIRPSHCRCASELGQDRYRAIRAGTPETHFCAHSGQATQRTDDSRRAGHRRSHNQS